MKIRIRFAKFGVMKFIGHLDMVRYFQKVFRRAGIDMQYSQGFSPHQLISFASPLGVGVTSDGEYMDIFVNQAEPSQEMIKKLNREMTEGVKVLSCKQIEDETKHSNAMAIVAAADYLVSFRDGMKPDGNALYKLSEFYNQENINVLKKSKKSEREVDIKPMIHALETDGTAVKMLLDMGSVSNLKPELVMEAFYQYGQIPFDPYALCVHRLDMYMRTDDEKQPFKSLDEQGLEIV